MNKMFLSLCFLITNIVACQSQEELGMRQNQAYNKFAGSYFIDHRTNLCFITNHSGMSNSYITYVPCTPEVMNLVVNKK